MVKMAIRTLRLSDLIEKTGNLYEAIVIMSKRARAINLMRAADREEIEDDSDEEDEVVIPPPINREDEPPKPSTVSLDEMLSGDLEFRYPEVEEDLFEDSSDSEDEDV